jgi:hypothetical protein
VEPDHAVVVQQVRDLRVTDRDELRLAERGGFVLTRAAIENERVRDAA